MSGFRISADYNNRYRAHEQQSRFPPVTMASPINPIATDRPAPSSHLFGVPILDDTGDELLDRLEQAGRVPSKEKFRRMACNTFIFTGACPYNDRCVFLHDLRIKSDGAKARTTRQARSSISAAAKEIKDTFYWPDMIRKDVIKNPDPQGLPTANQLYIIPEAFRVYPNNFHNRGLYSLWTHFVEFCTHNAALSEPSASLLENSNWGQRISRPKDISSDPFFNLSGYIQNPHVPGARRLEVFVRLSMTERAEPLKEKEEEDDDAGFERDASSILVHHKPRQRFIERQKWTESPVSTSIFPLSVSPKPTRREESRGVAHFDDLRRMHPFSPPLSQMSAYKLSPSYDSFSLENDHTEAEYISHSAFARGVNSRHDFQTELSPSDSKLTRALINSSTDFSPMPDSLSDYFNNPRPSYSQVTSMPSGKISDRDRDRDRDNSYHRSGGSASCDNYLLRQGSSSKDFYKSYLDKRPSFQEHRSVDFPLADIDLDPPVKRRSFNEYSILSSPANKQMDSYSNSKSVSTYISLSPELSFSDNPDSRPSFDTSEHSILRPSSVNYNDEGNARYKEATRHRSQFYMTPNKKEMYSPDKSSDSRVSSFQSIESGLLRQFPWSDEDETLHVDSHANKLDSGDSNLFAEVLETPVKSISSKQFSHAKNHFLNLNEKDTKRSFLQEAPETIEISIPGEHQEEFGDIPISLQSLDDLLQDTNIPDI